VGGKRLKNGRKGRKGGWVCYPAKPSTGISSMGLEGSASNFLFAKPKPDMERRVVERDTAE